MTASDPKRHAHRPHRKGGAAAKAGHNLTIEVTSGRDARRRRVELTADARSLRVARAAAACTSLGDEEKAGIAQTIDEEVLKGGKIAFRSTQREGARRHLEVRAS